MLHPTAVQVCTGQLQKVLSQGVDTGGVANLAVGSLVLSVGGIYAEAIVMAEAAGLIHPEQD